MSVQSNTYIMVGAKLPFSQFEEELRDQLLDKYSDSAFKGIEHTDGLCMLSDGMSGQYVYIGRVLHKTNDQNGDYGFDKHIDLTNCMTAELQSEVKTLISDQFGFSTDVRLWAFTHYR